MTDDPFEGGTEPTRQSLCALVEKWREEQADCTLPRSGLTNEGYIYKQCADDLEELINHE